MAELEAQLTAAIAKVRVTLIMSQADILLLLSTTNLSTFVLDNRIFYMRITLRQLVLVLHEFVLCFHGVYQNIHVMVCAGR